MAALDQITRQGFIHLLQVLAQTGEGDLAGQVGARFIQQQAHRGGWQEAVKMQLLGRRAVGAEHQFGHQSTTGNGVVAQ